MAMRSSSLRSPPDEAYLERVYAAYFGASPSPFQSRGRSPHPAMPLTRLFLIGFLGLALLSGCAQQNNAVVGRYSIQKRKYQPGWHVELFQRSKAGQPEHTVRRYTAPAVEHNEEIAAMSMGTIEQEQEVDAFGPSASLNDIDRSAASGPRETFAQASIGAPAVAPAQENQMPRKRLQPLAIPSALLVGTGITLAFVSNSALLVAAALLMGLVLAAVSLRRIRTQERSGKGFALVALVLGTMAALITTMVIIRSGF